MRIRKLCLLLLLPLITVSCGKSKNQVSSSTEVNSSFVSEVVSSNEEKNTVSSQESKENSGESSVSVSTSSQKVSSNSSSVGSSIKPISSNSVVIDEDFLPANKNSKVVLGTSNNNATKFEFKEVLPDNFRYIYGNNYTKAQWYANGELKISSTTQAKQGFQTCMFDPGSGITNGPKIELRILIGQMNNSSGETCRDDIPVLTIGAFNDCGNKLGTYTVDNFDKTKENNYVRVYLNGKDVSFLEVRATQLPYKGSQKYNFGLRGIEMVAWPYAYND